MINSALSVIVHAKPGKEEDVADFLRNARGGVIASKQHSRSAGV